jgi:thymidylate synthase (FAD)
LLNESEDPSNSKTGRVGLARELARINLPLNAYTQWYWKIDLHNLLHFLELRSDSHAQYEIRAYAEVLLKILKLWTPSVYDAFLNFKKDAMTLSGSAIRVLKKILAGQDVSQKSSGLSRREWSALMSAFELPDHSTGDN